jgi:hypothetical protein
MAIITMVNYLALPLVVIGVRMTGYELSPIWNWRKERWQRPHQRRQRTRHAAEVMDLCKAFMASDIRSKTLRVQSRSTRLIWASRSNINTYPRSRVSRSATHIFCSAGPRPPDLGRCRMGSIRNRVGGTVWCLMSPIFRSVLPR